MVTHRIAANTANRLFERKCRPNNTVSGKSSDSGIIYDVIVIFVISTTKHLYHEVLSIRQLTAWEMALRAYSTELLTNPFAYGKRRYQRAENRAASTTWTSAGYRQGDGCRGDSRSKKRTLKRRSIKPEPESGEGSSYQQRIGPASHFFRARYPDNKIIVVS